MINEGASGSTDSFPTTQWSLVGRAAREGDPDHRRAALAKLLEQYLPSLRRATAQMGLRGDHADDVLQSFICDRVIQQNILSAADEARGRFRAFIFTSLRNFVFNEARARRAAKRSPERLISLNGDSPIDVPADGGADAARDAFDAAWVQDVLAQTLTRMRGQCESGREPGSRVWHVFEWRVLGPATTGDEPIPYDVIAARLGNSALQAANLLVTGKRMFARELRTVIAQYTRDAEELEDEIRTLKVLAG